MRQIKHPFSLAIYELDEDYNVLVTKGNASGVFDPQGRYIHGEIRSCDPELARWVGLGPRERGDISQNRRYMNATETIQRKLAEMAEREAHGHVSEGESQ
jgi:hypothetical protein